MKKYPSYCCQQCGVAVGWIGRLMPWLHTCPTVTVVPREPISQLVCDLIASIERGEWSPTAEFEATPIAPDWWSISRADAKLSFSADRRKHLGWVVYELHHQDWMNRAELAAVMIAITVHLNHHSDLAEARLLDKQRSAIERAVRREAA